MALTEQSINHKYRATIDQAKRLEAIADECASLASSAGKMSASAQSCWIGKGGTEARNVIAKWKKDMTSLRSKLLVAAADLRRAASVVKAKEMGDLTMDRLAKIGGKSGGGSR